jgi:hypothetical protein
MVAGGGRLMLVFELVGMALVTLFFGAMVSSGHPNRR